MIVTKNELLIYVDVDETIIFSCEEMHPESVIVNYYNVLKWVRPHKKHIKFLKSLKTRGYHVVIHSANGWRWAEEIVRTFELSEYVDEIKTKPIKYIDDQPVVNWFGQQIYLDEE